MARSKAKSTQSASRSRDGQDAIALLKADHREVEGWFEQFERTRSDTKKSELADMICQALRTHMTIEEEVFYPAFLEETQDNDMHNEAKVEHNGAKKLIAEIEGSSPNDDYYDAKVKVLSEMIKHHVKEEEQRDGMFAKARKSEMDLRALGSRLEQRKADLIANSGNGSRRRSGSAMSARI